MASRLIEALKKLSKKTNTAGKVAEGGTVEKVLESMADNFDLGGGGGTSVVLEDVTLTTNASGAVIGGVCGLSNGQTININVTTE